MFSVAERLKDVAQRFGLIADYVVEQGNDGIWTYRKWDSGMVECWAHTSFSTNITVAVGNIYYNPRFTTVYFPNNLFIAAPTVFINTTTTGAQWAQANNVTMTYFRPTLFYASKYSNTINWYFDFYAKGRWK